MNCYSCSTPLQPGATYCPNCGAAAPAPYPVDKTVRDIPVASAPYGVAQQTPPTAYGSASYGAPSQNTYGASPYGAPSQNTYGAPPYGNPSPSPYGTPPASPYQPYQVAPTTPFPSPPSEGKPTRRTGVIIGVVLLVLVLVVGSVLVLLVTAGSKNPAAPTVNVTATVHAQATSTAAVNPYTHNGTLALFDPLHDNSKGYGWSEYALNCSFTDGAYHAKAPDIRYSDYCMAQSTNFSNFVFEIQMTIIKGDIGGILFRGDTSTTNKYYMFSVAQTGAYDFVVCLSTQSCQELARSNFNAAIKQGLNQANTLAVVAQGHNITLYVNQQQVDTVIDSNFSSGQIGVEASTLISGGHPTEVVYTNARVWTL